MNLPKEIDVAVIGGGPAGVTAGAAAALRGARSVLLIEAGPQLGGSVTAAMHRVLCGLYSQQPASPLDTLNSGLQREVIAIMLSIDPASVIPRQMGLTWVLEFPGSVYEAALLQLLNRSHVLRMMNTRLIGVRRDNSSISAIQLDTGSGSWLNVKAVIDCTGSGALLQLTGEDVMLPADPQRMLGGYALQLTGLTGDPQMLRLAVPYVLSKSVASGHLPPAARFTVLHPGPGPGEAICKLAVNPQLFQSGEIHSLAEKIVGLLKAQVEGCESAKVAAASSRALPRDGRRLKGKAIVNDSDVLHGRQLPSSVAHAWWPIERWDINTGPTYAYPPAGRHYDIPDAALQSEAVKNLFTAGLCVSATAPAAASIRASGICLATGQAAGKLAAQCASGQI